MSSIVRLISKCRNGNRWRILLWIVVCAGPGFLKADVPPLPLAVEVSTPSVPAGAIAQIRLTLAAPHRIHACSLSIDLDPAVFGSPADVQVFSATGDQTGEAVFTGNRIDISFESDTGGIGRLPGVLMAVINVPVLANAAPATTIAFPSTDPTIHNKCDDALGYQYGVSATSSTFKVGGTVSIDNVTPGGGLLPAASKVQIIGRGFAAGATVQIDGVALSSVTFVAPQEIDVTLATPADLTGRRVLVTNPSGSVADFYPALTGKMSQIGTPPQEPFQPILSQQTYFYAGLGFNGFVIQNPARGEVNTLLTYDTVNRPISSRTETLEPGEILSSGPTLLQAPTYVSVRSDVPVRMLAPPPAVLESVDLVGLAVVWDGPNPFCDDRPSSPPTCWLAVSGSAPLTTHATVTWNNAVPFTVSSTTEGGQWLTLTMSDNHACVRYSGTPCSAQITLTATPSLPPGDYKATVTVTADDPTLLPASFSFVFRVALSVISLDAPHYISFAVNDSIYSRGPAQITVNGTKAGTPFSVSVHEVQEFGWLSVTPTQGVTPAVLNVYVNPSPSQSTGIGSIDVFGPSNTVMEPVNMFVLKPPETENYVLTPTPAALTFWAKVGGSVPAPQFAVVNGSLNTVTTEEEQGLGWLSARHAGNGTNSGVSVSVNPAGLAPGVYHGTVTFSGPDTSPYLHLLPGQLAVTLVVWADAPAVSFSPADLVISAPSGGSTSATLTGSSSYGPVNVAVSSVTTDDGNNWLTAGPFFEYPYGNTIFGSLLIGANAGKLPPGIYHGSVQVRAPPDSPAAVDIPVTLNVTPKHPARLQPGPPLAASILNAASQTLGSVAPGESVTILGLGLSPLPSASFPLETVELDAAGTIGPTFGSLRVFFDGVRSTLVSVSEIQVNAVVPEEVAGKTSAVVTVEVNGMRFTTGVPVAATDPAVFTADSTGIGQAAAFNSDSTSNSAANPAMRGSDINLTVTGLGHIGGPSQQQLPISVTIGGVAATVDNLEHVPGRVPGLFQLTARVPPAVARGPAVPVVVTVGSSSSPAGVTIAVQ